MKQNEPISEAKMPKGSRQPSGRMSSVSSDRAVAKLAAPEPPLQNYVAEVAEHTEVRKGVPLPLGPHESAGGVNFNKLLLDPYATAISRLPDWDFGPARGYDPSVPEKDLAFSKLDDAGAMPKCVLTYHLEARSSAILVVRVSQKIHRRDTI